MTKTQLLTFATLLFCLTSCNQRQKSNDSNANKTDTVDVAQLELRDSSLLTHIKGQFYKNKPGQIFERTFANHEVKGIDTLVSVEYFNGKLPQEIDPLTFEQLDGWFAKDKNFAYYYRPTSGGMLIVKLDSADVKTFHILEGHYNFASDKTHIYHQSELLQGLDLTNLKIVTDEKGFVIKLISGKDSYTPY